MLAFSYCVCVLSFFLFFDAVVRVYTGMTQTVRTRKITIIARDLYVDDDDDVVGWLLNCQVLRIG